MHTLYQYLPYAHHTYTDTHESMYCLKEKICMKLWFMDLSISSRESLVKISSYDMNNWRKFIQFNEICSIANKIKNICNNVRRQVQDFCAGSETFRAKQVNAITADASPWCWQCRINGSLSLVRTDFNHLHISMLIKERKYKYFKFPPISTKSW